jgi:hypothetical protein
MAFAEPAVLFIGRACFSDDAGIRKFSWHETMFQEALYGKGKGQPVQRR